MSIWIVRAGGDPATEEIAINNGFALIGWNELPNLSEIETPEGIREIVDKYFSGEREAAHRGRDANQISNFIHSIENNDICILPYNRNRNYYFGRVKGGYHHFPDNPIYGQHGREVRWVNNISRTEIPEEFRGRFELRQTVFQITNDEAVEWIERKMSEFENAESSLKGSSRVLMRKKIEEALAELDDPDEDFIGSRNTEYWVVSTVEKRSHKKFASKAVVRAVGFENFDGGGGWTTPDNASSILHNEGYIIVDDKGIPIKEKLVGENTPIPDGYSHLLKGTERILTVAENYYVEPAIELEQNSISIDVYELHDRIGLSNQHDVVENALIQLKKEKSNTINIEITKNQGENGQSNVPVSSGINSEGSKFPKNQILYGPPGTSKTYDAITMAVEICLGEEKMKNLLKEGRKAVVAEYKKLLNQDRIVFVTFHQSFSYEEFVEGLRPTTGNDSDSGSKTTGGFSLKPHEGVFQKICRDADREYLSGELKRSQPVYQIGVEYPKSNPGAIQKCLDNSIIQNEWAPEFDLTNINLKTIEEFKGEWEENVNEDTVKNTGGMRQLFNFKFGIKNGDYVVLAKGRDKFVAVGEVEGSYYYDQNNPGAPHCRKVKWHWKDIDGRNRSDIYSNQFHHHATYKLESSEIHWDSLDQLVFGRDTNSDEGSIPKYVLIIDEINRANISKVLGELITLLEPDKRIDATNEIRVQLPYSRVKFGVPENLYIIGTMNTADRSIALLDTALRRRFKFKELLPDSSMIPDINLNDDVSLRKFFSLMNDRIEFLHDREHQIGHAYFMSCKVLADVEEVFRESVIPLLAEYFYEDRGKIAKVLGDYNKEIGCFYDMVELEPESLGLEESDSDSEPVQRWKEKENFEFSRLDLP